MKAILRTIDGALMEKEVQWWAKTLVSTWHLPGQYKTRDYQLIGSVNNPNVSDETFLLYMEIPRQGKDDKAK